MGLDQLAAQLAKKASESGDAVTVGVEITAGPSESTQKAYRVVMVVAEIRKPLLVLPLN